MRGVSAGELPATFDERSKLVSHPGLLRRQLDFKSWREALADIDQLRGARYTTAPATGTSRKFWSTWATA